MSPPSEDRPLPPFDLTDLTRQNFLKAVQSMKLRVENQPSTVNLQETLVPVIDFQVLATANTHLIYGRRGTGKTHLLSAFSQYCESHFKEARALPVYLDFRDLDFGPVLPTLSIEDLIPRFYRRFIGKIVSHLRIFSDTTLTLDTLGKLFGGQ
jgi:hypothetical protein